MAMALASPDTLLTGIDRAAILIMALERTVARQLLQQMDTDEIRRVADHVVVLESGRVLRVESVSAPAPA